jgi:hypothetical protein
MLAQRLADITKRRWRSDNAQPSDAVLSTLEECAAKGFAWCMVDDQDLSKANLRWLSAEGFRLQKMAPRGSEEPVRWRITWVTLPIELDAHNPLPA